MYLQSAAEPTQAQDKARVQAACLLASLAVRALIEEADLTPKPALVMNAARVHTTIFRLSL